MMHRCSNMVGPCTCGLFHGQSNVNSFSMLFSMPKSSFDDPSDHHYYYNNDHYPSHSSSVDCTLSLGTPSTRVSSDEEDHRRDRRSSVSNFCWDILQPKSSPSAPHSNKPSRGGPADPLLARRCANCDTTSTPLWRNGPRGPKSLCNACGIRFKKEERRASAAAASGGGSGGGMTEQHQHHMYNTSWSHQTQKMPCYSPAGNEFRFVDDVDGRDSFLSWRLNVTDRPGLVHDFTR